MSRKSTTNTFGIAIDRAGQTGSLALRRRAGLAAECSYITYARQPFSVTLQGRFIDSGVIDATRIDPSDAGYAVLRWRTARTTITWRVRSTRTCSALLDVPAFGDQTVQVFAAINNLFDKEPPFAPEAQYPTNPTYFDQIGRTYRVGARISF